MSSHENDLDDSDKFQNSLMKLRELELSVEQERMNYNKIKEKYEQVSRELDRSEKENMTLSEEVDILSQKLNSREDNFSDESQNGQMISRLNAKITQLKRKEQVHIEENARLESLYNELLEEYEEYKMHAEREKNELLRHLEGNNESGKPPRYQERREPDSFYSRSGEKKKNLMDVSRGSESGKKEFDILRVTKERLENDLIEALNREKSLHNKLESLNRQRGEDEAKIKLLHEEVEELEAKFIENQGGNHEENQLLKQQNNELENQIFKYEEILNKFMQESQTYDSLREQIDFKERVREALEKELMQTRTNYSREMEDLIQQVTQLKRINQEYKGRIEDLENHAVGNQHESNQRDDMIEVLKREIRNRDDSIEEINREKEEIEQINRDRLNKIKILSKEVEQLRERTQQEFVRKDEVEKDLEGKVRILQDQITKLTSEKLSEVTKYNSEQENQQRLYQDTISILRKDNKDLEMKYMFEVQEKKRDGELWNQKESMLRAQISSLSSEVEILKDRERDRDRTADQTISERKGRKSGHISKSNSGILKRSLRSDSESPDQERFQLLTLDLQSKTLLIQELRQKVESLSIKLVTSEKEIEILIRERDMARKEKDLVQKQVDELYQEKERLIIQAKGIEKSDSKIMQELNDLRDCMNSLRRERDRIYQAMKIKEETVQEGEKHAQELIRFIQTLEAKNEDLQHQLKSTNESKEEKFQSLLTDVRELQRENNEFKNVILHKDFVIGKLEKEKTEETVKVNVEMGLNQELKAKMKSLERRNEQEEIELKTKTSTQIDEKAKANQAILQMKDEMLEQNKNFQETIDLYEDHIKILKEKFCNDLNEINHRVNVYFSQYDVGKRPANGSPKKEKKNIYKLFETYKENASLVCQKEAVLRNQKEKLKAVTAESKTLKSQINTLKETNAKLTEEVNMLHKKSAYRYKNNKTASISDIDLKLQTTQADLSNTNMRDVAVLEAQLYTAKTELQRALEESRRSKEINQSLENECQSLEKSIDKLSDENRSLQRELNEVQRIHKTEMGKIVQEVDNMRLNLRVEEPSEKFTSELREAELALKSAKEEIQRKKEIIQNLKSLKDEKEEEIGNLKIELEQLSEELEKQRRLNKEIGRKDNSYKEMKEKIESLRASEKNLLEERNSLLDRVKLMRNELSRKEVISKEIKDKLDKTSQKLDSNKQFEDESEKMKETIRKLKQDVDRKDTTMKNLRSKYDQALQDMERTKAETLNITNTNLCDLDKESKRHELTKMNLKKLESQYQLVAFLLKRILRENLTQTEKLKNKLFMSSNENRRLLSGKSSQLSKFTDSMNILNLAPEDIGDFLEPDKTHYNSDRLNNTTRIDQLEGELSHFDNLNINNIYNLLNAAIEERIDLERQNS